MSARTEAKKSAIPEKDAIASAAVGITFLPKTFNTKREHTKKQKAKQLKNTKEIKIR